MTASTRATISAVKTVTYRITTHALAESSREVRMSLELRVRMQILKTTQQHVRCNSGSILT